MHADIVQFFPFFFGIFAARSVAQCTLPHESGHTAAG
jgi:hypothetical protein